MALAIMHNLSDLRTWAEDVGFAAGASPDERRELAETIHNDGDGDRPAWGRDWSDYLSRIDVVATIRAREVVYEGARKQTMVETHYRGFRIETTTSNGESYDYWRKPVDGNLCLLAAR